MSQHTFCHIEWTVTDLERAKAFLGGLFHWKFESFGDSYVMIATPSEELGGGLMKEEKVSPGMSPNVYVFVEEIQTYLDKAVSLGGKICVPKTEISPETGWFGIVADQDGNCFGLYQSPKADVRTPFNTFCHVEWTVSDHEKARSFFEGLFGWSFRPSMGNYLPFMTPSENVGGGLMQEKEVAPGQSPCVYVEVQEIEPYLEKVTGLGGAVAAPKTEIPGMGWFAILLDHDKNAVGIYESAQKG